MKKIASFSFLIMVLFSRFNNAQTLPDEILYIPWNVDSMGSVTTTLDPEGRIGPQNFRVEGDQIYLLDQQKRVINCYENGRLADQLPVIRSTRDFIIHNKQNYSCLENNAVVVYKNRQAAETIRQSKPLPLARRIKEVDGEIIALNHDGTQSLIQDQQLTKIGKKGIPAADKRYEVIKRSRSEAVINIYDETGVQTTRFDLVFGEKKLGSIQLIGADTMGRIYLDVDLIVQEIPLRVQREVRILASDGSLFGTISVPSHYYAMMWNDLRLSDEGILYHMLSSEDGIHILKWDFTAPDKTDIRGVYPAKFREYLHYNQAVQPESLEKKTPLSKPASVTRAEALAIGDTYVVHSWTATSANITNGLITDPDGKQLRTPSWVQVGANVKVPYKWGGFNTLPEYDQGLLDNKSAGDNATSDVSSYAVGVDCSGFVSRCWKLSSHYSTRMMDDYIAQAYSSWTDLKPGDAIHRPGHVRLAVDNNPNGTILAVEAAGSSTDWRVDYRTYTYSGLSDYTPRYYINMTGPALPLAQPVLLSTKNDSRMSISWELGSTDNVSGIQIDYSSDGNSWSALLGDSLLSPSLSEFSREWANGPAFIRLKVINNDDGRVESLPSDIYGFYSPPACAGKVLIVDGFDRAGGSGSWGLPYHAFAQWMGTALAELKVSFETVANEAVIAGDVLLSDYQAVYWILGDESTADETFSASEQSLVADYLRNGGQLFVSGSEIAWDLYGQDRESTADRSFLLNYLHADYDKDDSGIYNVIGSEGGIFAGLPFEFDDGSGGIYEEDYPDQITPRIGAVACLEYSAGNAAAIQYEGTFSDGATPGKLVYFGFPWETITDSQQRKTVLKIISEWFGFTCNGIDPDDPVIPLVASLSRGYPNPFNSQVQFDLALSRSEPFDMLVYNSRGQKIRHIHQTDAGKAEYVLGWDGRNDTGNRVASGTYFFQVVFSEQTLTQKIIYLK